ncbi:8-oxoguanine deaminase [Desulforhopalus sp. IMCC35007]|uniref:8-oxoguanine deaminase n=1 Tax=Desulforhopalus sp. IMCC35007 TaxID=2569543 RepID=UPI0010AEDE86|nr:8-oxoguanine deaminase [Desulforhopalus sp. IMCC35007]TKB06791.1 8-oxoguanine deaminase [Desulforhopalus sp. IMCC35007]
MSKIWIKNPLAVYTLNGADADGGIVVTQNQIVELVPKGSEPKAPCDAIFDASKHVVLPGLINTHHHFYQTLTRAVPAACGKELFDWLKVLYNIWAKLTPAHIEISSRLALAELLLSGCTTASDHHYVFPAGLEHAIDLQIAEAAKLGIRVALTRGSMSLSIEDGGLPPKSVVQSDEVILTDSERLIKRYHQPDPGAMVQLILAPCSPFSVSEALMAETARLARRHGVRLHTHLAETHDETSYCVDIFGVRPVDYLERVGWLKGDVWLAHGIQFEPEEISRLGAAGVGVSHCPSSNMVLASGICSTLDLEAAGCPVGLGVDGSASNDCSNIMQEVRQALLLQRLKYGAGRVSHLDALRWGTQGSARCLGRDDLGEISPGKQADLALFTLDELRFSGSGDPLAALVMCGAHRADYVMVAGKWVVKEGEIPGLDLEQLMSEHSGLAKNLLMAT